MFSKSFLSRICGRVQKDVVSLLTLFVFSSATFHPFSSSFELNPCHERELWCLLLHLLFFKLCFDEKHRAGIRFLEFCLTAPGVLFMYDQSSVARGGGCEAKLKDTCLSNVHYFSCSLQNQVWYTAGYHITSSVPSRPHFHEVSSFFSNYSQLRRKFIFYASEAETRESNLPP